MLHFAGLMLIPVPVSVALGIVQYISAVTYVSCYCFHINKSSQANITCVSMVQHGDIAASTSQAMLRILFTAALKRTLGKFGTLRLLTRYLASWLLLLPDLHSPPTYLDYDMIYLANSILERRGLDGSSIRTTILCMS